MPKSKSSLTAQDIAALAAGGVSEKSAEEIAAEQAAAAAAEATAAAAVTAAAEATAAAAAAEAAKPAEQAALISVLQGQAKDLGVQLAQSGIDLKAAQDKVAAMEATHEPLLAIARGTVSNMHVAVGGAATDMATAGAAAVIEQHKVLLPKFLSKYKVGGVASTVAGVDKPETEAPAQSALDAARLGAVRSPKK